MSGDASGWQLTESDPGVFTELLQLLGTPLVMDEVYSLDAATLEQQSALVPIQALIFLFKWIAELETAEGDSLGGKVPKTGGTYEHEFAGFFAKQVVNNSCATLAIINCLGNIPGVPVGPILSNLFEFAPGMDPLTLGEALTSSTELRTIHNSLSPPNAVSLDGLDLPRGEAEDAYHFVVYLPVHGTLYELDGLKRAAVSHGAIEGSWIERAAEVISKRISMYPAGSIEFNLQSIQEDPIPILESRLSSLATDGVSERHELQSLLAREQQKRKQWTFENALRRHNHLGMVVGLLKAMARSQGADGKTLFAEARGKAEGRMRERIEEARQKKAKGAQAKMEVD